MLSLKKHQEANTLLIVLFIVFASACSTTESKLKKYGSTVTAVILSDSGVFRGVHLGEKLDSVMMRESIKPQESDENYLYYEYKLDSANSFNISYNFNEAGLNEIQSDIYIHNPNQTETVFDAFKLFFDDHYGNSENHGGYTVWTIKSSTHGIVRINLSDESADFTVPNSPGKLSIWIYPDQN
jgi:hypothetical protein